MENYKRQTVAQIVETGSMKPYRTYVKTLKKMLADSIHNQNYENFEPALNGQPYAELRNSICLNDRRKYGVFFTGHELADKVVKPLSKNLSTGGKIIDPACGTGNLLLACSKYLPLKKTLIATVNYWGEIIYGHDIHHEFVQVTKLRLLMMAILRKSDFEVPVIELNSLFPNITVRNGLKSIPNLKEMSIVLMNPPYTKVKLYGSQCEWAKGSTSLAALFLEHYISLADNGAKLIAILPDVLRTGSLYEKWRKLIEQKVKFRSLVINGIFDEWTDIDVFVARLEIMKHKKISSKKNALNDYWKVYTQSSGAANVLQEYCDVSVGAVVPHRLTGRGSWQAYIHAKICPPDKVINVDAESEKIRFSGTVVKPPFIVIRRTSRPQESRRILATIVKGSRDVAVENHLIVLVPNIKTIKYCKIVAKYLNSGKLDGWLNQRLRCRHLTTSVVKEMPFEIS